jgi:hypothetical protein
MSHRTRKTAASVVEHAGLDASRWQQHRNTQRIRAEFEARERARGRGRAQATQEPVRPRRPTRGDNTLKDLISRGFSEETARAMVAGKAPTPYRYAAGGGWIIET